MIPRGWADPRTSPLISVPGKFLLLMAMVIAVLRFLTVIAVTTSAIGELMATGRMTVCYLPIQGWMPRHNSFGVPFMPWLLDRMTDFMLLTELVIEFRFLKRMVRL